MIFNINTIQHKNYCTKITLIILCNITYYLIRIYDKVSRVIIITVLIFKAHFKFCFFVFVTLFKKVGHPWYRVSYFFLCLYKLFYFIFTKTMVDTLNFTLNIIWCTLNKVFTTLIVMEKLALNIFDWNYRKVETNVISITLTTSCSPR